MKLKKKRRVVSAAKIGDSRQKIRKKNRRCFWRVPLRNRKMERTRSFSFIKKRKKRRGQWKTCQVRCWRERRYGKKA